MGYQPFLQKDLTTLYIPQQPAFNFFKGFGLREFEDLVNAATQNDDDTVWIPKPKKHSGLIGLSTWYANILLYRLKNNQKV